MLCGEYDFSKYNMGKIVERFWQLWKTNSEFIMKQDLAETEKYLEMSNYVFCKRVLVMHSEESKIIWE